MIASTAIADLPVWRSPMISSRWPRPIGIIPSIALSPVCRGSLTGWRWTTPGALNSAGRVSSVSISPLPSSGLPSGSTMRPSSPSPTGISSWRPVRLTVSPSTMWTHSPNSTAPTLSDSSESASPVTSWGSSSISSASQFSRPCTRAMPSATDRTVPTSVRSASPSSRPSMRLLRMLVISSGLICMKSPWSAELAGSRDLLAEVLEAIADGGVEHGVADPDDDAAEDVGVDLRREVDLAIGLLGDPVADLLDRRLRQLDGGGDGDGQEPVLVLPQLVELRAHAEQHRHAVLLDQQLEEVDGRLVGAGDRLVETLALLAGVEVRGEQEHLQLARAVQCISELAELVAHLVELALLLGDLEQGAGVDRGDLLHGLSAAPRRPPGR